MSNCQSTRKIDGWQVQSVDLEPAPEREVANEIGASIDGDGQLPRHANSTDDGADSVAAPQLALGFECMLCHWGAATLVEYAAKDYDMARFLEATASACRVLGIYPREVCKGMVENVGRQVGASCVAVMALPCIFNESFSPARHSSSTSSRRGTARSPPETCVDLSRAAIALDIPR